MKNWKKLLIAVLSMSLMMAFTSLAGEWKEDANGWWYENDDGSYYTDGWHWIDGNGDGIAECYFFGFDGYIIEGPVEIDGSMVDENGAWVTEDGIQTKAVGTVPGPGNAGNTVNGGSQDPYAVYKAALEKNNNLDGMDVSCRYDMTMTMSGQTVPMTMDVDMKMRGVHSGPIQFIMSGNMNMMGMEMPVTAFYTDGYYYMEMMGEKMKMAMPMDQAMEAASSNTAVADVDVSQMKDLQMRTEGDMTVLSFTMDAAGMTEMMGEIMGSNAEIYGSTASYIIHSASGEIYINKDGYYTKETILLDMDMVLDGGETMNCKMNLEMNINNPGQPVDFTLPSTEGFAEIAL